MNWERHFRSMKRTKAQAAFSFGADYGFGAIERGIMPPGVTDSRVIPPGRYWLDVFGDKIKLFQDWAHGKPEVKVETSQEDTESSPPHLFVIFSIPETATNFGMTGVLFPTTALGFPTVAEATVQSSDDTVRRPDAQTSSDIINQIAKTTGGAIQSGFGSLSSGTLVKAGLVIGAVVLVASLGPTIIKAIIPRNIG